MKKGKKKDWRLGTILTELSMLSAEELEFALKMTRSTGMPLGTVLLVTGALTKDELRAMIKAQSMLKDNLIDESELLSALPLLKEQQSLGLEGALRRIKWHRDSKIPTNKLGELLVSAKLLSQLDLAKGLAHNRNSLQPLGRTLVLLGSLSPRALQHALVIQERIRKGELSREQGVTFLRDVCARNDVRGNQNKSAKQNNAPAAADVTRLGDLLVEAGLVKEDEFSQAMDVSAYKSQLIGEILIECKLLSRARLQAALELQRLVGLGLVGRAQAIATLKAVTDDTNVSQVLEKNIAEEAKKRLLASEALTALASQLTGLQLENPRTGVTKNASVALTNSSPDVAEQHSEAQPEEPASAELPLQAGAPGKATGDGKKGSKNNRRKKDPKESKESKESKGSGVKEAQNTKDANGAKESRDSNEAKDPQGAQEIKDAQGVPDGQNINESERKDIGESATVSPPDSSAKDPVRERIRLITEHLHFDVLNGTLDVEQAMIALNVCLKENCSVPQAIAKMGWTVGVRPFRESEINYSDSDLIDWLTQED